MNDQTQKLIIECEKRLDQSLPTDDRFDITQANAFVREILTSYMYKKHPKVLKDSLLLDTVALLSLVACSRRVKVENIKGGTSVYPNIYVIKIMPSASGKDLPLALAQDELLDGVKLALRNDYQKFIDDFSTHPFYYLDHIEQEDWEDMSAKEQKEVVTTYMPNDFIFSFDEGTLEGFISQCQSVKLFKKGTAFVLMQEFGSYISGAENDTKKSFLVGLMKAFDVAEFGGKVIKGSKRVPTVRNIPAILIGNTSGRWIKGSKDNETLMKFVGGGLGRRSFIYYPQEFEIKQEGDTLLEVLESRKENYEEVSDIVFDLRNKIQDYYENTPLNKEYKFTQGAKELVEIYTLYGELKFDSLVNDQESVASEYRGRAWKMIRLAGLFAWLNNPKSGSVGVQDVREAIYFTEYLSEKTAQFIYEQEAQPFEKLFEFFKRNPGKFLKSDLRKENFIPYHTYNWDREFEQVLQEARIKASQEGYEIVQTTGNHNAQYTQMVKVEYTDPRNIPIMVAPAHNMTYKQIRTNTKYRLHHTSWDKLHEVVKKYAYMPQLNNGHRAKKDAIPGGVLMGLDIDENWSLEDARSFLKGNKVKSLIVTTASHQKTTSKDGKEIEPQDKFRVLILLSTPFTGDADAWSRIMVNVMDSFKGVADAGCKDISRFFFPSPEDAKYYYIGGDPLDWREWDFEKEQTKTAQPTANSQKSALESAIAYANEKYGAVSKGGRDSFLNEIWHFNYVEKGISQQETYEICKELNKRFCNPAFSDKQMEKWDRSK